MDNKVKQIVSYFLQLNKKAAQDDDIEPITHLKMQKLVYYAQGMSFAYLKQPLFSGDIEAWQHGPVLPCLYEYLKDYKKSNLMDKEELMCSCDSLEDDEKELLEMTFRKYGIFTAFRLRDMTHQESPWCDNYHRGEKNKIPNEQIRCFFENDLEKEVLELQRLKETDEELKSLWL